MFISYGILRARIARVSSLIGAIALVWCLQGANVLAAGPSIDCQPVLKRYDQLQNVAARFRFTRTYATKSIFTPAQIKQYNLHPLSGAYSYHGVFRFLDGRAYYDLITDEVTRERYRKEGLLYPDRSVDVMTHERAEQLTINTLAPQGIGTIRDHARLPSDSLIELALGLRCYEENEWLGRDTLQNCIWERTPTGLLTARLVRKDATPGGPPKVHLLTFDPARGYALTNYSVSSQNDTFFFVDCSDMRNVDGVVLPFKIMSRVVANIVREEPVRERQDMVVEDYQVRSPENSPDSFYVRWEAKAFVHDMRTGALIKQPTTGPITDDQIIAGRQRRQATLDALALPRDKTKPVLRWLGGVGTLALMICIVVYITGRRRVRAGAGG